MKAQSISVVLLLVPHQTLCFRAGIGKVQYSLYLEQPDSMSETRFRQIIAGKLVLAVQRENVTDSSIFQFLKADENSLQFDEGAD